MADLLYKVFDTRFCLFPLNSRCGLFWKRKLESPNHDSLPLSFPEALTDQTAMKKKKLGSRIKASGQINKETPEALANEEVFTDETGFGISEKCSFSIPSDQPLMESLIRSIH